MVASIPFGVMKLVIEFMATASSCLFCRIREAPDSPARIDFPGFRVRIIPVLGTIPAIFGQVMASYVVTQLAGVQVHMEPVVNIDIDHYRVLHQRLIEHEELQYGTTMQVQVDAEEVMYIVKELWHGRSAMYESPKEVGHAMWRSVNELILIRWDRTKPACMSNLILLRFKELMNMNPVHLTL
ncbi:tRNA threonylcarbamoyladenosine dehydratase-like isoform X1 [Henckelia pumila]|uniref:tRNA threonylcarbamoyladenosine dehydratase-like isoform X1 n=2 Tax=Henckelia pumila TaxID=405737 RepID=UPI003C6DF19F